MLFLLLFLAFPLIDLCQPVCFFKTFGGAGNDFAFSVQQTNDGGFIISGQTNSFGGTSSEKTDMWVVKLNQKGEMEWDKTYGGAGDETGFCMQQISTEGYVLAGFTSSFGKGYPAIWIIKLNNTGDTLWTRFYEGIMVSYARSVKVTSDSGFVITGKGDENILKLDKNGKKVWGKRYGWIYNSVDQTLDGGYILGGDTVYKQLEWDYIPSLTLTKIDRDGRIEWKNPFGEIFPGSASSVMQTKDEGYIVSGDSIDLKTGNEHAHFLMVSKLDKNGNRVWTYYGSENSNAQSVRQTSDEGFIVSGNSIDSGHGLDVLVIRLDKTGKKIWSKTYGKSDGWEYASDALQSSDNGYIVAGQADSYGAGRYDWWILKLDENGDGPGSTGIPEISRPDFTLYENFPNPFRNSTTLSFYLPEPGFVKITIFNLSGEEVSSVASRHYTSGKFMEVWKPQGQPGGIYFFRFQYNDRIKTKMMVLQD